MTFSYIFTFNNISIVQYLQANLINFRCDKSMLNVNVENDLKMQRFKNCVPLSFRNGNLKTDGQVDLVLCCVDNFEARMTVNIVSTSTPFDMKAEACLLVSLWSERSE